LTAKTSPHSLQRTFWAAYDHYASIRAKSAFLGLDRLYYTLGYKSTPKG
jgi:hypothetical protein